MRTISQFSDIEKQLIIVSDMTLVWSTSPLIPQFICLFDLGTELHVEQCQSCYRLRLKSDTRRC